MIERSKTIDGGPTGIGLGLRWAFLDDVLEREALPGALAFFEVSPENYMRRSGWFPDALHRVAERHPLLTHGLMMDVGGTGALDADYLGQLRGFLGELGATHHSDHLCWSGQEGQILHDLLPLTLDRHSAERVADRVRRIQDRLGVPLALENISYYLAISGTDGGAAMGMRERDFVCEVLERADCGLLLDVNNVHVNATNHGFDAWDYIRGLPLDRVVQLHVAGGERLARFDDLVIDTHGADVAPAVVELMQRVVRRVGPLPVLYERDHAIPPLDELLRQVATLDEAYREALSRPEAGLVEGRAAREPLVDLRPEPVHHALSRIWLDADVARDLERDVPAVLARLGAGPQATAELERFGASRVLVYRQLVRNGIRTAVRGFLRRTAARLGDELDRWYDRWLAERGPRSRYLRDMPLEFFHWARPLWEHDESVPAYMVELARHELLDYEVAASASAPVDTEAAVDLASPLLFDGSVRLVRYAHAIHELSADPADRSEPEARPTILLAYRDTEHDVRYLSLSALADEVLTRLLEGATLGDAVTEGAKAAGEPLDGDVLGRISALLADLHERGAMLGVPARGQAGGRAGSTAA